VGRFRWDKQPGTALIFTPVNIQPDFSKCYSERKEDLEQQGAALPQIL